jgi:hypothetical protein
VQPHQCWIPQVTATVRHEIAGRESLPQKIHRNPSQFGRATFHMFRGTWLAAFAKPWTGTRSNPQQLTEGVAQAIFVTIEAFQSCTDRKRAQFDDFPAIVRQLQLTAFLSAW